jgi:hypothetical protein
MKLIKFLLLFGISFLFQIGFSNAQNCDNANVPKAFIYPPERRLLCLNDTIELNALVAAEPRWFKNGVEIAGATENNLVVTSPGVYTVKNFADGCYSILFDTVKILAVNKKRPVSRQLSISSPPAQPGDLFTLSLQSVGSPNAATNSWYRRNVLQLNQGNTYQTRNLGLFRVRTDSAGCSTYSNSILVSPPGAILPQICSTTVIDDPLPNQGVSTSWAATTNPAIQNFFVYVKRGGFSTYRKEFREPQFTFYNDTINPNESIEVRLTALVNGPGGQYETDFSPLTKTIFLKVFGSPAGVSPPRNILTWNTYEGYPVEKTVITRSVGNINGPYVAIDTLYNSVNVYEDINPPANAFYGVEALNSSICQPWARVAVTDDILANVRKSRSNKTPKTQSVNPMLIPPYLPEGTVFARYRGYGFSLPQSSTNLVELLGFPSGGIWSGPDVIGSGLFQPLTCGTKKLVYEVPGIGKDSTFVTVLPAGTSSNPVAFTTASPNSVCGTSNATFGATPTAGTWASPVAANGSLNAANFRGKTISVEYSRTVSGCAYKAVRLVPVFPSSPALQVSGNSAPCSNQAVNLSVNLPTQGSMSFQWKKNNVDIADAISNFYQVTQSGSYSVSTKYFSDDMFAPSLLCTINSFPSNITIGTGQPPAPPVIQRSGSILSMTNYTGGTNTWYRNGIEIPGQTGTSITLSTTGLYHARRKEGSCNSELSNAINFDVLTRVPDELTESGIRIFPNPVPENFQIEAGKELITEVLITDLLGKKVKAEFDLNPAGTFIRMVDFPYGIYNITLKTKSGRRFNQKIVHQ